MKAYRLICDGVTVVLTEKELYFSHVKCVIKLEEGQFKEIIKSVQNDESIIMEKLN